MVRFVSSSARARSTRGLVTRPVTSSVMTRGTRWRGLSPRPADVEPGERGPRAVRRREVDPGVDGVAVPAERAARFELEPPREHVAGREEVVAARDVEGAEGEELALADGELELGAPDRRDHVADRGVEDEVDRRARRGEDVRGSSPVRRGTPARSRAAARSGSAVPQIRADCRASRRRRGSRHRWRDRSP